MKDSLIIVVLFLLGIFGGYFSALPDFLLNYDWSLIALYIMLFLAGVGIGSDTKAWKLVRENGMTVLLVPLSAIIGTFGGAFLCSFFLQNVGIRDALAIVSGFSYYSLSSVMITHLGGEMLGVTSLLANMIREIITLLGTPLLVRFFGKLAPIMVGGAAAMDSTLPIITRFTGKEYAILSVCSGVILTLLVPVFVTLLFL